ncbi:MAG TPA: hypothetical protein VHR40_13515 [Thermoleophilaceae bacterium]|jgi:hypothetical protein|nr:hypothetical protein [Thermoleophilaceae bacterium]
MDSGPARVAVVSFLAARAAPVGGFWIALAGGVALARVAQRRGARLGFGASIAAMLETVAIIGPARIGIPLTQAITAPMLGRLESRGWRPLPQILACGLVRLIHNSLTTAFFIWVIAGGLDAYAGTYDAIGRRIGIEVGTADALLLTVASLLAWAAFASTIQVLVYRRGLASWDQTQVDVEIQRQAQPRERRPALRTGRGDPRLLSVVAVVTFVVLLATTKWPALGLVAAGLAAGWLATRREKGVWRTGAAFAAVLAAGAFVFGFGGGLGLDMAARRATRAALLVLTATWLRAAAGAEGLREVSRRMLLKLRRVPSAPEAAAVLDQIESEGRLAEAGRALEQQLRGIEKRPVPLLDAVLRWVVRESQARADTSRL